MKRKKAGAYLAPMPAVTDKPIRGPLGFTRRAKRTDGGVDVAFNAGNAQEIARLREHAEREAEKRANEKAK